MRNSSESTAMRSTRKEHVDMEIENIFQKDHFINRSKKKLLQISRTVHCFMKEQWKKSDKH